MRTVIRPLSFVKRRAGGPDQSPASPIDPDKFQAIFEEFYRCECQALYRYVYAWVGNPDDTLEIVQESFSNLYQMQSGKASPGNKRILFWIARNKAVNLLHRRNAIPAAFEKLAGRDREYLALRLSGLNYEAIAEIMDIDPESVSQAINQALRRFEAYD